MKVFRYIANLSGKKYFIPILLALIALALVFMPSLKKENDTEPAVSLAITSVELEERVKSLCESVAGIDHANVLLTLDTSEEYVLAKDTEKNGEWSKSEYVMTDGNNGMELYVINPKVRGVAVVCTGGERPAIQKTVSELISASLGIDIGKVSVAGT